MKFNISEKTAEMIAANILGTADDAGRDELAAWLAAGEENRAFYCRVADPANLHRFLDETSRYDAAQDWPRVREKRLMASRRRGIKQVNAIDSQGRKSQIRLKNQLKLT